ncbi:hypothetical protein SUGI_0004340 [Cryptomeria japonica]|uniref:large ribosomal subunit protein bL9c n=1 Tax=Cryptomeria japonica TaxID=3369 RepID=UPI002408EF64|nr:large ribosomal subunit protein bL9c [Cryptomeria japonica]GLJ04821.1 hypothetical protein SUGI_0004340 [Cryptomeria japonica]
MALSSSHCLGNLPRQSKLNLNISNKPKRSYSYQIIIAYKKAPKTRQIVLTEDVSNVGQKGELVKVKAGFYRNYLSPRGQANLATPKYLKEIRLEQERKEAEKKRVREELESLALMLEAAGAFKVKRKTVGKGKQIFGRVSEQDLSDIIKAQLQRNIDKRIITIPEIRELGQYVAEIKLHPEVTARVQINVIS